MATWSFARLPALTNCNVYAVVECRDCGWSASHGAGSYLAALARLGPQLAAHQRSLHHQSAQPSRIASVVNQLRVRMGCPR